MPKTNSDDFYGLGIKPIINPFLAFILYFIVVHYFCFSLWPLAWWKICVHFDLLNELTAREFIAYAARTNLAVAIMLLFLFFSAGYNTTDEGHSRQTSDHFWTFILFPIYRRIVSVLNNSLFLTILVWLTPCLMFFCIKTDGKTMFESPMLNLENLASDTFYDFSSYYKIAFSDYHSIYFPFSIFSLTGFPLFYILFFLFATDNRLPFFILLEPLNKHFWQRIKSGHNSRKGEKNE